jgi:hypothetical protein
VALDHTTLMTAVFTQNYLHEIPTDIQLDIMNYSKSKWRLNFDNLDNNNFDTYMLNMIKKDMSTSDTTKHDTVLQLHKKLISSYTTYQFANQKLSEAINDVLKYQNEYDFDLYELFNKIKIKEEDSDLASFPMQRIYDWNKQDYIDNPNYVPNKDWEYSSDEDEDE